MPRTFLIVTWLMLVVPSAAYAQGIWLQKGVSGVGAEVTVSHVDSGSSLELQGGYSYQGFLDFELGLGVGNDNSLGLTDLSVYALEAVVLYHPLKQTREIPVSLKVQASYSQNFYSSDTLSENDTSLSAWGTLLAGGVYRFFPLASRIGVTPEVDLGWRHSSATVTIFDTPRTGTDDSLLISLGAAFAYLDSAGHIWGVAPGLSFGPGSTSTVFSLSVAFITTLPGAH